MIKVIKNKKNAALFDVKMVLTRSQTMALKQALEANQTPTGEELSSVFSNAFTRAETVTEEKEETEA